MSEEQFLNQFPRGEYGYAVRAFVKALKAVGYLVTVGAASASIRFPIPEFEVPVTVGWLVPPGITMSSGARDVTLGSWSSPGEVPAWIVTDLQILLADHLSDFGVLGPLASNAQGVQLDPESF